MAAIVGIILFLLTSLLVTITYLWLVVIAFKESPVWGLICLFVPVATTLFAILHWDEAGSAFLTMMASTVVQLACMAMMFSAMGFF